MPDRKTGFILISLLTAGALLSLLIMGLTWQTLNQIKKINFIIVEKKLEVLAETGIQTFLWQKKYQPQTIITLKPLHQSTVRKQYAGYLHNAYYEKTPAGSFYLIYGQKGDVLCVAFLPEKLEPHTLRVVRYYDGSQSIPWQ
jgi:hypothetical protein